MNTTIDLEWVAHIDHRTKKQTAIWCSYCSQDADEPINENNEDGFTE